VEVREGENIDAQDKNQSIRGKTISEDRHRKNCLFQITCQSHIDQEIDQTEASIEAEPIDKQIGYQRNQIVTA
jgi:hypothetical protein